MELVSGSQEKYFDGGFLDEVIAVDTECYDDRAYVPGRESIRARYFKNRDSYIFLYDGGVLAGYISFFPVTEELEREFLKCRTVYDDNIGAEGVADYSFGCPLLIYSIAVKRAYRGTGAAAMLMDGLSDMLDAKAREGRGVRAVYAYAVSGAGEAVLHKRGFSFVGRVGKSRLFVKTLTGCAGGKGRPAP